MTGRGDVDLAPRSLVPFLAMTFGIAWGLFALMALFPNWVTTTFGPPSGHHPLFILAVYAPAIAAFTLVLRRAGIDGLARYLSRLGLWRAAPSWWLLLLFGIPVIYVASAALQGTLSGALPFDGPGPALAAMGFMLILGPMEEFGWRGVALPLLQRRLAPFWASLVLGLVWGLWHLPAFILGGTPQSGWDFSPFVLGAIAISLILTPLFNASGGSIALAMLFHFQLNNPLWPDAQPLDSLVFAGVAVIVTLLNRKALFSRAGAVTRVIPASPR
ncbi:MAG: CPBP family intramembrane glutamic endopeptidase [Brevundimonas sp.]